MKKLFFILACFPLLFGFQISGDFVFYPGILFPLFYILWTRRISSHLIFVIAAALIIAFLNRVNLVSLAYYLFGLMYIICRPTVSRKWIESTFNIVIFICFVSVVLDFTGVRLVDFLTSYDRRLMIDDRSIFHIARPTGFYREPSALGLVLGSIYAVALRNNLKINFRLLIVSGLSTLSLSFVLVVTIAYMLYSTLKYKSAKLISVLVLIAVVFKRRLLLIVDVLQNSNLSLEEINLSIVKRYVQPTYAMIEFLTNGVDYRLLFGFGPGGYKEYLQSSYAYIIGSDLGEGYLLNIYGNYLMSFGIIFGLIFLFVLRKVYSKGEFPFLILLFCQGIAVVHPVFLIASLKIKK